MLAQCSTVTEQALIHSHPIAVRTAELSQPLVPLTDTLAYWGVRVFVTWQGIPVGSVDIANEHQHVTVSMLNEAIAAHPSLLQNRDDLLRERPFATATLPDSDSVSIILPTCDRPQDLRNCLRYLTSQQTSRTVEIIVVDNRPDSGITPSVVAEFPGIKLVNEHRPGSSYARNTGVHHSGGDIIVTIDDDARPSVQWLEKLIAPFARSDVMSVAGNVLPVELETSAQQLFELYAGGGLCRGFRYFETKPSWLKQSVFAAPVWELGVTANAAFRASIFHHPAIGLWEESLGAGVPVGGGEDIYFFYRILSAGYTHVYEPRACVWHRHRRDFDALCCQIRNYSRGFIAHLLMTCQHYGDWRSIVTLLSLPLYHLKQIIRQLTRLQAYPITMIIHEAMGHLSGIWGLWRSRQHVRRYGRSSLQAPTISNDTSPTLRPLPAAAMPDQSSSAG